jgi:hypothetical protein
MPPAAAATPQRRFRGFLHASFSFAAAFALLSQIFTSARPLCSRCRRCWRFAAFAADAPSRFASAVFSVSRLRADYSDFISPPFDRALMTPCRERRCFCRCFAADAAISPFH